MNGSTVAIKRWIPNALTGVRLLLLPGLLALMTVVADRGGATGAGPELWTQDRMALVALFLLMAATDWLDGHLARRLRATTRWGSMADALADRLALLVPLLYVALRQPAAFPAVPLWIPLWLLALDTLTAMAWLVARRRYRVRRPASHQLVGRAGVWLLFTLVLWVLAGLPTPAVPPLAGAGLVLVTLSSMLYVRRWFGREHA